MTPTRGASASSPSSQPVSAATTPAANHTTQPCPMAHASTSPQTEYSTMTPLPGIRRKNSLGPLRRAHPASGATWNVEVIRGKMTSRCLWHACRALVLGMVLMVVGAGMATIGYYAVPLSTGTEVRGNSTAFIKNISRGYHLNNLSYIGPIVMGFGGFIVVAACVMTFEARDSAAKVVPARFKMSTVGGTGSGMGGTGNGSGRGRNSSAIQRGATGAPNGPSSVGSQTTTRWDSAAARDRDGAVGSYRASPGDKYPDRQALTAALIHFSRALGTPGQSPLQSRRVSRVSHSGSVPNLHGEFQSPNKSSFKGVVAPINSGSGGRHHHHHHNANHYHPHRSHNNQSRRNSSRHSSLTQRSTREHSDRYLHPGMLKYHRHAISVDESHPPICLRPILSNSNHNVGSQPSMNTGSYNISPTHEIHSQRQIKRSDTAKQHVLARQRHIEREDNNVTCCSSPKAGTASGRRRSSTASDASMASRHTTGGGGRRASTASRTPSIDSRNVYHAAQEAAANSIEGIACSCSGGGEGLKGASASPKSWRVSAQISTPSVEKEFRSQLSICSEPAIACSSSPKALSCQSSIEPCVPEETDSPDSTEKKISLLDEESESTSVTVKQRPDTLILECPLSHPDSVPSKYLVDARKASSVRRKRPKAKVVHHQASVGEIYFISSAAENKDYDSIEVIDERRNKSFGNMGGVSGNAIHSGINNTNLERTDTVIYRALKDNSNITTMTATNTPAEVSVVKEGEETGEMSTTNEATTLTTLAEIEQRTSSNTRKDNSDGG